jgi:hypothetical protein
VTPATAVRQPATASGTQRTSLDCKPRVSLRSSGEAGESQRKEMSMPELGVEMPSQLNELQCPGGGSAAKRTPNPYPHRSP